MDDERRDTCANRIRKALTIRGMKQSELCQITKIPKSAISQYISGCFEPKQDRIYLIAKTLSVSEAWLMGYDVPMERDKETPPSPTIDELSEGEKALLELFNRVPEDQQKLVLQMIRAALGSQQ
jgi:transcriptional regulator with XRE-family HTH domain